jgi:hypothetical protein
MGELDQGPVRFAGRDARLGEERRERFAARRVE